MFISFDISNSTSFCECNSSECYFLEDFFETVVVLSAVLLLIKSPLALNSSF